MYINFIHRYMNKIYHAFFLFLLSASEFYQVKEGESI